MASLGVREIVPRFKIVPRGTIEASVTGVCWDLRRIRQRWVTLVGRGGVAALREVDQNLLQIWRANSK
jgi:hypothetical protein